LTPSTRKKIDRLEIFRDKDMDEATREIMLLRVSEVSLRAVMRTFFSCYFDEKEMLDIDVYSAVKRPEVKRFLNVVYDTEEHEWIQTRYHTATQTARESILYVANQVRERFGNNKMNSKN
jgi:hypothetical protein